MGAGGVNPRRIAVEPKKARVMTAQEVLAAANEAATVNGSAATNPAAHRAARDGANRLNGMLGAGRGTRTV